MDFDDLAGGAEKGHLDLYVAINVGIYGEGELNLPDNVDARTAMGWNAVCAVYESSLCSLILDTDPEHDTSAIGQYLGYYRRTEEHGIAAYDWWRLLNFAGTEN